MTDRDPYKKRPNGCKASVLNHPINLQQHIINSNEKLKTKMSIKMSLFAIVACCLVAMSFAAPSGLAAVPLAAAAPVVAAPAPVVTAYSSQYVARNYNGVAVAPAVVPSAPIVSYPAPAPIYAPAAYAYPSPLVQDYLF